MGGLKNYISDFTDMSVRRPYRHAPDFERVRVLCNLHGKVNPSEMLIIFSSPDSLRLHVREPYILRDKRFWNCTSPCGGDWSIMDEILDTSLAICRLMGNEWRTFSKGRRFKFYACLS
jgi:hypothetical protein